MEDDKKQQTAAQQEATNEPKTAAPEAGADTGATGNEDSNVKVMSALAYLGILFFLPLVVTPESKEGRFHANQGLVILIASVVVNFVGTVIPIIGWLIILPIGNLILFILAIMGIVNALNGRQKKLPMIGGIELIK